MKIGKPKSKRTPVRLRHKIEKASAAKQRKQRKEAKTNPQWRSRLKKDPGIPNLFPYKAQVLAEIEESKRKKGEEVQRRKEVARAQRMGRSVDTGTDTGVGGVEEGEADENEELMDHTVGEDEDEEMEEDGANPMAALLASAQARARAFDQDDEDDDSEEDDEEEDEGWTGVSEPTQQGTKKTPLPQPASKALPKPALDDPIKTVTKLISRMEESTEDGVLRLMEFYQLPPLVTAGSDFTTRYLVEVARKRGRLGRGGIPNLHSAALTVLSDLHEGRLVLPSVTSVVSSKKVEAAASSGAKGEVKIVTSMAEPFKLEGLWGDEPAGNEMVVET